MKIRLTPISALLAAYAALAGAAIWWWFADTRPPLIDPARHLLISMTYYRDMSSAASLNLIKTIYLPYHYYPPLLYVITSLAYKLFGTGLFIARATVLLFLLIAALAIYASGAMLKNKRAGALAGILFMAFPIILEDSKVYMTEVPLAAMVALGIFFILKSDFFSKRGSSIMAGLIAGLGMLIKWVYPLFLIGPLIICAARIPSSAATRKIRTINLVCAFLVMLIIAGPWYIIHEPEIHAAAARYGYTPAGTQNAPPILSLDSFIYYPFAFFDQLLQLPMAAIFMASLAILALKRKLPASLLSAVIAPMAVLFFVGNKQARYLAPALSSVAILTAVGLLEIDRTALRRSLIALALVISSVNTLAINFGLPSRSIRWAFRLPGHDARFGNHLQDCVIFQAGVPQTFFGPPRKEDWKIAEILGDIALPGEQGKKPIGLGLLTAARPCFAEHQFFYTIARDRYPIRAYYLLSGTRRGKERAPEALLKRCDFVLAAPLPQMTDYTARLRKHLSDRTTVELIKEYPLPDGSKAYLYRCSYTPVNRGQRNIVRGEALLTDIL